MSRFQTLMHETYLAHKNFKDKLRKWEINDKNLRSEPKLVAVARNVFFQQLDLLYSLKIEPLERKFKETPSSTIDELIEFLSIDIAAHRCGYAKEVFLQWLKKYEFSTEEIEKFQQLALKVCEMNSFRREFRRWCRLMIKIADADFILRLRRLLKSDNHYAQIKSKWMIEMIQRHRADLCKI